MNDKAAQLQLANNRLIDQIIGGQLKEAADTLEKYTRVRLYEESVAEKVLPSFQISDDELDLDLYEDKPMYIAFLETDSPGAISVPLGTTGEQFYLRTRKYPVHINQLISRRAVKNVDELRSTKRRYDLRQITADLMINSIHRLMDERFFGTVTKLLVGVDQTITWAGVPLWRQINGGITRNTYQESRKIMERGLSRLNPAIAVVNSLMRYDFEKWGRDEVGGDFSQDLLTKGFSQEMFANMKIVTTIKHDLVPENRAHYFAPPEYLGKHVRLYDPIMHVERKMQMVEFQFYMAAGMTIGHPNGCVIADFRA